LIESCKQLFSCIDIWITKYSTLCPICKNNAY